MGKELYAKGRSTLPTDFFECCTSHFGMHVHQPVFIGVRSSQVRGLFLPYDAKPLAANQPVVTIPLTAAMTCSSILQNPNALPRVTLQNVRDTIQDPEFQPMAAHIFLGLQMSSIVSHIPDTSRITSNEEAVNAELALTTGMTPWARLVDDEDFNEQFIFGMFGMALDAWQRNSFNEITKQFHKEISRIHSVLRLPFSVDLFRRMTRLLLARAETLPLPSVYDGPRWQRRMWRLWKVLTKQPTTVPTEVGVVPYLDMINHSNRPNVHMKVLPSPLLGGKPAVVISTIAPVNPGQELCRHYNFALSRPNALFRYGFLPFDLISIVENDAIHEHLVKNQDMLEPEAEATIAARQAEMDEIAKLEKVFKQARSKKPTSAE